LSQYSQFGRSCSAMIVPSSSSGADHGKSDTPFEWRISLDFGRLRPKRKDPAIFPPATH
jgi:hypothetical protein